MQERDRGRNNQKADRVSADEIEFTRKTRPTNKPLPTSI